MVEGECGDGKKVEEVERVEEGKKGRNRSNMLMKTPPRVRAPSRDHRGACAWVSEANGMD